MVHWFNRGNLADDGWGFIDICLVHGCYQGAVIMSHAWNYVKFSQWYIRSTHNHIIPSFVLVFFFREKRLNGFTCRLRFVLNSFEIATYAMRFSSLMGFWCFRFFCKKDLYTCHLLYCDTESCCLSLIPAWTKSSRMTEQFESPFWAVRSLAMCIHAVIEWSAHLMWKKSWRVII